MTDPMYANNPTRPGVDPWSIPLEQIDVSNPELLQQDAWQPFFKRLREEDPVHYCADSFFGPYWSVTRFKDIQYVDTHHQQFSSDRSIVIGDLNPDFPLSPGFIAMDPPTHDEQRHSVQPVVAPPNLKNTGTADPRARAGDSRRITGRRGV